MKKTLTKAAVGAFLFALAINSLSVMANWKSVSAQGSKNALDIEILLGLLWLMAILVLALSCTGLIFKKTRKSAFIVMCSCLIYIIVGFTMGKTGALVRMNGFKKLAHRSQPLILAIQQYENEHGHPPNDLNDLVPEFFTEIPSTGMGAYPEYQYKLVCDPNKWDGNPWVLYVYTPSGGINWDMFVYFPKQNYPEYGYGGRFEKIGQWAYVHE